MNFAILISIFVLFVSFSSSLYVYQDPNPIPNGYVAYKTPKGSITIDGSLTEPAWKEVSWSSDFVDIQGSSKPKPRYLTKVKIRYDDDFLYIGGYLEEPNLTGWITKKDSVIFYDNDFEIFINPSGNLHLYDEYEMNALNTTWTLVEVNPYRDSNNIIDPYPFGNLMSGVWLNGTLNDPKDVDCCWTVEIALPYDKLRQFADKPIPPKNKDQWRINFSRVEWRYKVVNGKYVKIPNVPEDNWVWSPQQVIDMHQPERWGFLQYSEGTPGQEKFEFRKAEYEIQQVLSWVYRAQKNYFATHKIYASHFSQLDISMESFNPKKGASPIDSSIRLGEIILDDVFGFDVSVVHHKNVNGREKMWHMRNDSKQWFSWQKYTQVPE
eukprot:TRINITY_DN7996_c0_g1_i1.p1 TRINITY_DN7996_c0_g1~~TRINITY_DN7996_c0_g1_i1.p1  ORF type:complete len:380 (-),score=96.65 TRINITY_DN7996_c0_g1_i1:38-1177(-)